MANEQVAKKFLLLKQETLLLGAVAVFFLSFNYIIHSFDSESISVH